MPATGAVERTPRAEDAFAGLREAALAGEGMDVLRGKLAEGLLAHGVSVAAVARAIDDAADAVALLALGDDGRRSRLGGRPELPPRAGWPTGPDGAPMSFIARIDLGDLPDLEPLPREGVLLVYWLESYFELERMDFRASTRMFSRRSSRAPSRSPRRRPRAPSTVPRSRSPGC